jgi:Carboxypeptidase regulatory-like domain
MKFMAFRHRTIVVLTAAALSATVFFARAQEPPPPPAAQPPQAESSTPKSSSKSSSHIDWFLVHGTVFDEKALSLPGAQLRIKRQGEKKYRWNTYSNSRGEFAIRIPPGSDYEVVAQAQGFAPITQPVDAKNGLNDQNLVFRMQRSPEGKK